MRRFLHERVSFARQDMAEMFQVDYIRDMTLVAVVGEPGFEKVIAVANYFLEPASNMAEVAFSVAREWQHKKGISTILQRKS